MEDLELTQDTVILNEPTVTTVEGAEETLPLVIGELNNITDEIELTQDEPMMVSLETNSITYSVDPTVPSYVREITEDQIDAWDYASFNAHEHDNKDVLDEITAPFTIAQSEKLALLHNYDGATIEGKVATLETTVSGLHNYDDTLVKSQINALQTSVASLHNYDDTDVKNDIIALQGTTEQISDTLSNKVDKVNGKGLSTNDYTTAEKNKLASLYNYNDTDLQNRIDTLEDTMPTKVDKVNGKGLSSNDFTNEDKSKLDSLHNYDDRAIVSSVSSLVDVVEAVNTKVDNTYTKAQVNAIVDGLDIPTDYVKHNELTPYATQSWVENKIAGIDGFATREWVNSQGFLKEHQDLSAYAKKTEIPSLDGYATQRYVIDTVRDAQGDYATKTWVESQGYLKDANIPTKTSDLTNDSGFITEDNVPTKTSELTNDSGFLTEHQDISGKYDKTGGEITGNVKIDKTLTLDIEDEDYDAGIYFQQGLDNNLGTTLTLGGYANNEAEKTWYKVLVRNVATPQSNFDVANKKYVDDKTSITWITGFYDEQGLYVSSSAYNDCYSGITSNHTVYLKVTESSQVSILRLKAWKNFNEHSSGGDSFFFVDAIDLSTNKTATITKTSATFDTLDIETVGNKKTGVDANKDSDTYYPTTKATYDFVQDEFDRRKPVVVWETDGTTGLLGLNTDWSADTGWQVENVDMTPFKRVKFYVKPNRDSLSKNRLTPPAICEIFLDDRSTSEYTNGEYIGTYIGASPSDHNVLYSCIFVVSADKTKFKFQTQNSLYGTTKGGRNDNGRFCYLCEGYYD